jgi:hypothetical protein
MGPARRNFLHGCNKMQRADKSPWHLQGYWKGGQENVPGGTGKIPGQNPFPLILSHGYQRQHNFPVCTLI